MLKEGDLAPDFRLRDQNGKEIALSGLRDKTVVLYFYPKAMTPGCINEAAEFRDDLHNFEKLNTVVLGCSADSVEMQAKFAAKYKLNFSLLSDPEFEVIEAYNARRMKQFLGKSFLGIVRSTFVIGPDGHIVKIWPKAKSSGHAVEVLAALKEISVA